MSKMAGDDIGKVVEIFKGLSWYSLTVLIGLLLMIFIVYPSILKTFVKKIPYTGFFKAMGPAQTLAFSTSSSAATLPVTIECGRKPLNCLLSKVIKVDSVRALCVKRVVQTCL